ncbi:NUDIX domain-containing protein [Candidatus Saccharibacteria bacterium]|nr:NUDIX domain-containing protein [Candidatus Saccharibacteria bacterium]
MHKESWQNYHLNGQPVDAPASYGQPIPSDQMHGCGEIWLWRDNGKSRQILLQTRAKDKSLWPGYLDVSAAGHIDFGEQPIETAVREMKEELSLIIDPGDLLFLGALPLTNTWRKPAELELHFIYAYRVNGDLKMNFSDREVMAADWYDIDQIERAVRDDSLKLAKADSPLFDFVLPVIQSYS